MTPAKIVRPFMAVLVLILLLAGSGLLRPSRPPGCPRATELAPGGELIWESLSRNVLPQALR